MGKIEDHVCWQRKQSDHRKIEYRSSTTKKSHQEINANSKHGKGI